ncbi:MAG: omptin family outer membrane protease [Treponema sp.]|nr:omptin family outer membrane protease [Treponema sp.]
MKKKITIILFLSILVQLLGAQTEKKSHFFSIDISPSFGLMNGIVREYVIDEECLNTGNIESRLDWEVKNIPLFKTDADFYFWKIIHANINFAFGIPKNSGIMQDYDWLNSLYSEWAADDPTELTNYSKSDNKLVQYNSFGLRLGADIPLPFKIKIMPSIGYEYNFLVMSSYGGIYKYKSNNWEEKTLSGKIISYKQEYNSFLLGLSLKSETIPRTLIQADFFISPYATSINCLDLHLVRYTAFLDKIKYTLLLKGSAQVMYSFSSHHSAGIAGAFQYIPFSHGKDYQARINSNEQTITKYAETGVDGGTERMLWSVSLFYRLSL